MKETVPAPSTVVRAPRTRVYEPAAAAEFADALENLGVRVLRGTYIDPSGVYRAKQAPIKRAGAFNSAGLGASTSWAVFAADDQLCMTPNFSAVGDMRLRADLDAVVNLGDGVAWAPLDLVDQNGEPMPFCPRQALRNQMAEAASMGVDVVGATEIEFTLFHHQTNEPPLGQAYGLSRLSRHEPFVDDLMRACDEAGVELEQFHSEYGPGQFEMSVPPLTPLAAADVNTLLRILISRSARRYGHNASFSPKPFFDSIGNGAHAHLSFTRNGAPLLSGGDGPYGLTRDGERIIGSYVANLPEALGALASSVLSALRLQPSGWSGAYACWGLENREAAVRLCAATPGNPHGANIEVKCVDAATNIYVAYSALVGVALEGLRHEYPLPNEATFDPATLTEAERQSLGIVLVGDDQKVVVDRFESSALMERILGGPLVETVTAVRRHEADLVVEHGIEQVARMFQFAWSA